VLAYPFDLDALLATLATLARLLARLLASAAS